MLQRNAEGAMEFFARKKIIVDARKYENHQYGRSQPNLLLEHTEKVGVNYLSLLKSKYKKKVEVIILPSSFITIL